MHIIELTAALARGASSGDGWAKVYVCNCNGIREREVRAAIAAGARRPADIFRSKACSPKCAKCVCDMRDLIEESKETLRYAAE